MSQTVVEAIVARLEQAGVKVYDSEAGVLVNGKQEKPSGNYAVLYASEGLRSSQSLSDVLDTTDTDFQVTSVGTSPRGARSVASHVVALAGAEIAGGRVAHLASNMVRRDTDRPDVTFYFGTDSFTLSTTA